MPRNIPCVPLARTFALTIVFALASFSPVAQAQPATHDPGLPMWVVRDDDSTIYITGTVHLLRDEHVWTSPKLEAAFNASSGLWLELAEIVDPDSINEKIEPLLRESGALDAQPIDAHLTVLELATFLGRLKESGAPAEVLDHAKEMKPWMAIQALGRGFYMGGAYKTENGIDESLARLAVTHGTPVHGMEKLEVQVALMAAGTEEDQVAMLRSLISMSPAMQKQSQRVADVAFGAWVRGETHGVEALMVFQGLAASMTGQTTDAMLKDRNEAWAGVIEDMLKGAGVNFVAVGAAHLVGKDSLQERLKLRGIGSERY